MSTPSAQISSSQTAPSLEQVGPYRIEEPLGAGGMGRVYRAFDSRLGRQVAVKHIRPEAAKNETLRRRFRREARAAATLNHPSIVQVYDIESTPQGDWIVMELVDGKSLETQLVNGPLAPRSALLFARQIAAGLAHAHARGVVHRDLKSGNIMLTPEGQAKILDFGLAKQLLDEESDGALSVDGQIVGTVWAMSPEQAMGRTIDPRSDLFSFGTLLYEMVTGHSPFLADTIFDTVSKICTYRQPPARQVEKAIPQALSDLIDHLLEKERVLRPQYAAAVVGTLDRLVDQISGRRRRFFSRSRSRLDFPMDRIQTTPIDAATHQYAELPASQSAPQRRRWQWWRPMAMPWLSLLLAGITLIAFVLFQLQH